MGWDRFRAEGMQRRGRLVAAAALILLVLDGICWARRGGVGGMLNSSRREEILAFLAFFA